jgi:hypothetical protein
MIESSSSLWLPKKCDWNSKCKFCVMGLDKILDKFFYNLPTLKIVLWKLKSFKWCQSSNFRAIEVGKALMGHSQNKAFFSLTLKCHNRLAYSTMPLLLIPRPPIQILTCLCYKRHVIHVLLCFWCLIPIFQALLKLFLLAWATIDTLFNNSNFPSFVVYPCYMQWKVGRTRNKQVAWKL